MALSSHVYKMFARSPIGPLEEHIDKVHECVCELVPFFVAVLKQQWEHALEKQQHITELEQQADKMKRELRVNLPGDLLLPFPRSDLLDLLHAQDQIANRSKDLAGIVLGRKMVIPEQIADTYQAFLKRAIDAAAKAKKATNELDELLETGFRGKEAEFVNDLIGELETIERDTDHMQVKIRQQLFEIEKNLPPVDVIFLYKVIELTGQLADCAQHVGSRLQLLLAK